MQVHLLRLSAPLLMLSMIATSPAQAQPAAPVPFTVISKVAEANARVVALSLDFGQDLPLNWKLAQAFRVQAELLPVKSYAGDLIANSAAARAHARSPVPTPAQPRSRAAPARGGT